MTLNNLAKRNLSGIVYVILLTIGILSAWWTWAAIAGLFTLIIAYEFAILLKKMAIKASVVQITLSTALVYSAMFAFFISGQISLPVSLVFLFGLLLPFGYMAIKRTPFSSAFISLIAAVYTAVPFGLSAMLLWSGTNSPLENGMSLFHTDYLPLRLICLFLLIWTFDTFAFLSGTLLGKHKIMPKVSPKKSWEGFFGGMIFTIGIAMLLSLIWGNLLSPAEWTGLAIIVSVFGTIGDFMESQIKRMADVKDSGKILPGHGGLFDRLDSFIMIMPFAAVYLMILSIF